MNHIGTTLSSYKLLQCVKSNAVLTYLGIHIKTSCDKVPHQHSVGDYRQRR